MTRDLILCLFNDLFAVDASQLLRHAAQLLRNRWPERVGRGCAAFVGIQLATKLVQCVGDSRDILIDQDRRFGRIIL